VPYSDIIFVSSGISDCIFNSASLRQNSMIGKLPTLVVWFPSIGISYRSET
jgi:hypothetical protein